MGNAKKKGAFFGIPLCQNPEDMSICDKKLVTLEIWAYFYTRWLITAAGVWNRLWLWSLQPVQTLDAQNLPRTRKDLTLNWCLLRHPAKASTYLEDRIVHSHLLDICDPKTNHLDKAR